MSQILTSRILKQFVEWFSRINNSEYQHSKILFSTLFSIYYFLNTCVIWIALFNTQIVMLFSVNLGIILGIMSCIYISLDNKLVLLEETTKRRISSAHAKTNLTMTWSKTNVWDLRKIFYKRMIIHWYSSMVISK